MVVTANLVKQAVLAEGSGAGQDPMNLLMAGGAAIRIQRLFRGRQERKILSEQGIDVQRLQIRNVAMIRSIYSKTRQALDKDGGRSRSILHERVPGRLKELANCVLQGTTKCRVERLLVEAVNERMCSSNLRDVLIEEINNSEDSKALLRGLGAAVSHIRDGLKQATDSGVKLGEVNMIIEQLNSQIHRIHMCRAEYDKIHVHLVQEDAATQLRQEDLEVAKQRLQDFQSAFGDFKTMLIGLIGTNKTGEEECDISQVLRKLETYDDCDALSEELEEVILNIQGKHDMEAPAEMDKDNENDSSNKELEIDDSQNRDQALRNGISDMLDKKILDGRLKGSKERTASKESKSPSSRSLASEIGLDFSNLAPSPDKPLHLESQSLIPSRSSLRNSINSIANLDDFIDGSIPRKTRGQQEWALQLPGPKLSEMLASSQPRQIFPKNEEQEEEIDDLPVICVDSKDAEKLKVEPGWHELRQIEVKNPSSETGAVQARYKRLQELLEELQKPEYGGDQLIGIELGATLAKKRVLAPPSPSLPVSTSPIPSKVAGKLRKQMTVGELIEFLTESKHDPSSGSQEPSPDHDMKENGAPTVPGVIVRVSQTSSFVSSDSERGRRCSLKNFTGLETENNPQSEEELQKILLKLCKSNVVEFDLDIDPDKETHRTEPVTAWDAAEKLEEPAELRKPPEERRTPPSETKPTGTLNEKDQADDDDEDSDDDDEYHDAEELNLPIRPSRSILWRGNSRNQKCSVWKPKGWEFRKTHTDEIQGMRELVPSLPAVNLPPVKSLPKTSDLGRSVPQKKMKTRDHILTHPNCRALIEDVFNPAEERDDDDDGLQVAPNIEFAALSPHFKKQLRGLRRPENLAHLSPRAPERLKTPTTKGRSPRLHTPRARDGPMGWRGGLPPPPSSTLTSHQKREELPPVNSARRAAEANHEEDLPISRFCVVHTPNNPIARRLQNKSSPMASESCFSLQSTGTTFHDSRSANHFSRTASSDADSDITSSVVPFGRHAVRRANGAKAHVDIHLWGWAE